MKERMVPVPKSILNDILKRHEAGLPMAETHVSDLRGFIKLDEIMRKSVETADTQGKGTTEKEGG